MKILPIICLFVCLQSAAQPAVQLSNGVLSARILLPDSVSGYYRGTRFDWSGVIETLIYQGHNYHGRWFQRYDPFNHDAIMGPVEEFGPIGYGEGDTFVKIGVGKLADIQKTQQSPGDPTSTPNGKGVYSPYKRYNLVNAGSWKIKTGKNWIEFTHVLKDQYEYTKKIELVKGKARMIISHHLLNTGAKPINSDVYDHNFFVIDSATAGPAYRVQLPRDSLTLTGAKGLGQVIEVKENELIYLRDLRNGEQAYFPDLGGGLPMPYQLTVTNTRTGAGVRVSGDKLINKLVFWSSPTTVCPEPYIKIDIHPGKTATWKITYDYFLK